MCIELFAGSFGFNIFLLLVCCPHLSFLVAATEGGSEASVTNMKDTSSSDGLDTLKNRKVVNNIILPD